MLRTISHIQYHYIPTPSGTVAVNIIENEESTTYFLLKDYLGSILKVVDDSGTTIEERSFDAWGNHRDPDTWQLTDFNSDLGITRGYTGHEHLPAEFQIINMNGRCYDPVIGRVLSPDNYVVNASNAQDYNRYSYARNNPMKYTDPDGEWVHLVIGAIFGGFTNWAMNGAQFSWKGLGYFGVGAVAGALGAGVGAGIQTASAGASFWAGFVGTQQGISTILSVGYSSSFINGFTSGFGAGFASGFTSGFGNSLMQGQSFGQSLKEGGINGLVGGVSSGLIGGIGGGIDAKRDGRYFFTGRYDKFEQTIDGHKYYFYSDKKVIAEEAHRLSEGREVATYRVKESFLKKYSVILDPTGNTATESANYTLSYNGKSYLSSSRYRMLSQTHYDYSPLGEIGIGGIGDALFANKYNIPVTHVSYYNNFYTEFIPNQWTHSNYRNFINHNYVNLLDCFDKIFENVLRLW